MINILEFNKIYNEDCLTGMKRIDDKSIDMILCDLPYGTTACKWDTVIPFEPLWEQYKRIIKNDGNIVLTSSQPFTSALVMSNIKMFKYEIIWEKNIPANFCFAKYGIMKYHEDILIFGNGRTKYNPQMVQGEPNHSVGKGKRNNENLVSMKNSFIVTNKTDGLKHPKSVLKFNREVGLHPSQKPVPLFEYLIKTYSNEGDLILDNCIGLGTTAIACINTNRNYIGFETDTTYCDVANKRIQNIVLKLA